MTKYEIAFGKKVSQQRRKLGITQAELAEAVGVCRVTITNIERGNARTMLEHALKIADVLEFKLFDPKSWIKIPRVKKWKRT